MNGLHSWLEWSSKLFGKIWQKWLGEGGWEGEGGRGGLTGPEEARMGNEEISQTLAQLFGSM